MKIIEISILLNRERAIFQVHNYVYILMQISVI
jgi:hypothetical protein